MPVAARWVMVSSMGHRGDAAVSLAPVRRLRRLGTVPYHRATTARRRTSARGNGRMVSTHADGRNNVSALTLIFFSIFTLQVTISVSR